MSHIKKIFLLLFSFSIISFSQTPDKIVDIKVIPKTKNIKAGSVADLDIVISIKDGWHINSAKPLDPNLIATKLTLDDSKDFNVVKVEYPQPIVTTLAFSENELSLYEMEAVLKVQVKVNKDFKKDNLAVSGKLQYQPCNDQTCLFPFTKKFSGSFK